MYFYSFNQFKKYFIFVRSLEKLGHFELSIIGCLQADINNTI